MTEHEEAADRLERELDDMQRSGEKLDEQIADTRADWERKKSDEGIPGAGGDPAAAEGGLPPEADYAGRGHSDEDDPDS